MEKKNTDGKFPGYPHYPANEDITDARNNVKIRSIDEGAPQDLTTNNTIDESDEDMSIVSGTDADVTEEDMRMLEAADQNMDTTDSENLQHASLDSVDEDGDPLNEESSLNEDMTGEDLDVPGSSADDADERIGEEDEENNYYSLGGDLHESQEENKGE